MTEGSFVAVTAEAEVETSAHPPRMSTLYKSCLPPQKELDMLHA